ncbi:MAG: hypothetical protein M1115_05235 [Actinobacteria bacterium]|nr:hypothetical protein [Actinomycetota bacterium]
MNSGTSASQPAHGRESGLSPTVMQRRLPPVAELAVASVALMLSGGVYLAAHLPRHPPLGPAAGLLASGGAVTIVAMVLLSRIRPFAWGAFFLVARWALLAYAVIAGLLAFVFIYDHTQGATLVVLVLTLVVFAIDVPMVIAFTVARYQEVS